MRHNAHQPRQAVALMRRLAVIRHLLGCIAGCALLTGAVPVLAESPRSLCAEPLNNEKVVALFKQNAFRQLALEFGGSGVFIYDPQSTPVDPVMVRVEAYAKYPKPGQKELATMRIKGWVSRCNGTTIIRGNTWLADGSLQVPRYDAASLAGRGLHWGDPNAPHRFIVYIDSRCPHCHRLLDYARKLVEKGQLFLDLRQVAYLENVEDAVNDTLLWQTPLIDPGAHNISADEYLEMLGGFASEDKSHPQGPAYTAAKSLVQTNTKTAQQVLHIISVPGVLVQEPTQQGQYRLMGYWEINRIFR